MENGAAVEANLSVTPGQSAAGRRPMIAIVPANRTATRSRASALFGKSPAGARHGPAALSVAGAMPMAWDAMPATCVAQHLLPRHNFCAIAESCRRFAGTGGVQSRDLPEFPATHGSKTRLNFAAFCQVSSPAGISRNARQYPDGQH